MQKIHFYLLFGSNKRRGGILMKGRGREGRQFN
jgi:hypothetical protein